MGSCLTDYSCIMGLCLKKKKKTICFGARAWQAIIQRKYGAYWNIANYRSITWVIMWKAPIDSPFCLLTVLLQLLC